VPGSKEAKDKVAIMPDVISAVSFLIAATVVWLTYAVILSVVSQVYLQRIFQVPAPFAAVSSSAIVASALACTVLLSARTFLGDDLTIANAVILSMLQLVVISLVGGYLLGKQEMQIGFSKAVKALAMAVVTLQLVLTPIAWLV
jgi:hypothetical protein